MTEGRLEHLRRRAGGVAIRFALEGGARVIKLHPRSQELARAVSVTRNIPYAAGGGRAHRLDVVRPAGVSGALPVLLYLHGGGFRILSKDTNWMMAGLFARAGYCVFNVDYRLAPAHPYPAAIEDACRAAAWVQDQAAEHGGDAARWAVAGESAGANLACGLVLASAARRPEPWAAELFERDLPIVACLPACGLLQVSDHERFRRRSPALRALHADRLLDVSEGYLDGHEGPAGLADPLLTLESDWSPERPLPPMLAAVGSEDPILDDTLRLGRALQRRGLPDPVRVYPGEGHGFHAIFWKEASRRCWADQLAFVQAHLPPGPAV